MNALTIASLAVTYGATFTAWAFVVLYHLISRGTWRRESMGWHIMTITAVDAGIFSMLSLAVWWPRLAANGAYQWAYIAMVGGIPAVTVWRGVILWRLYRARPAVPPRPSLARPRWPASVWQVILGGAQVVNGVLLGHAGLKAALLLGAAQLGVACWTRGRDSAAAPVSSA